MIVKVGADPSAVVGPDTIRYRSGKRTLIAVSEIFAHANTDITLTSSPWMGYFR